MLKLTVAVLAIALASTAAAGWRGLRVDGSSEEAFTQSMTAFKDELSLRREHVFVEALKDIWNEGAKAAEAERRAYTANEYYKLLDGLRYEDVVNYTDPTGDTAKKRYRDARWMIERSRATATTPAWPSASDQFPVWGNSGRARGWTDLGGSGQK